jgi:hypothetical protein
MSNKNFRSLHEDFLLLPSAWDAGSARLIESLGAAAIAPTSAEFRGYPDGDAAARTTFRRHVKSGIASTLRSGGRTLTDTWKKFAGACRFATASFVDLAQPTGGNR